MKLPSLSLGCLLALSASLSAAEWRTSTFAGTGQKGYSGDGGPAAKAQVNNPFGVIRGPDGNIYFCEYDGQVVRKVDAKGIITTVAGSGRKGPGGDGGPALQAEFNLPHEIRFNQNGDLFIVDMQNHRVRKVDMKTGIISTVAGNGLPGFSGDRGLATQAQLKQPHSIQFDSKGDLYICDIGNHRIRKVDMKTGVITSIAGNGQRGPTPDGAKFATVSLNGPRTLDFDKAGNLWLALREGNQVFKLDFKTGLIHHIAGTAQKGFTGNGGPAKLATLSGPKGIALSPDNTKVYLADTESHSIRMVDLKTGNLELVCGTGEKGDGPDGDPLKCKMGRPHGVFVDADGSIFVGDSEAHRVRVIRQVK
ncbi:MAG: SMP-30/gluconolactonase/LRE family protein [Verrucomicrobiota bacterium]